MKLSTASKKAWPSPAAVIYGCGIVVTAVLSALAPIVDAHGPVSPLGSAVRGALFGIGFLLCVAAPFFAKSTVMKRVGFLIFAVLGYSMSIGAVFAVQILVYGAPARLSMTMP